ESNCEVPFSVYEDSQRRSFFSKFMPKKKQNSVYDSDKINDHESVLLIQKDLCQSLCPEIYMYLVLEKALSLTSMFVYSEIVEEFLDPIPSVDEYRLYNMDPEFAKEFAKQNPHIASQLKLQERKAILEKARFKLSSLLNRDNN
ncbi:hypothetical protein ROZALSC1DRAFT_23145, partial [Rozella allomycis CSF55]